MEYNAKVTKLNLESTYQDEVVGTQIPLRKYFYHEDMDYQTPQGAKAVMREGNRIVGDATNKSVAGFTPKFFQGGVNGGSHVGYLITFSKPMKLQTFKVVQVEGKVGMKSFTLLKHFLSRRFIKNQNGVVQQQFEVSFDRYGESCRFMVFKLRETYC